jgi:UDP-2,3-diacylglucosamine hydrolase
MDSRDGGVAFVGDVHIERDDPALPDFLEFLDRLGRRVSRIVFMGDLFNVWIAGGGLEPPHQAAVVERMRGLRRRGIVVHYLEGNRDYWVGRHHTGTAVDEASTEGLVEHVGGHRIWAAHGDLVNVEDRQYRAWRRLSRSAPVGLVFRLLPSSRRVRAAESIERRMRGTNLEYKRDFPERLVSEYARCRFDEGYDVVVLGHFHVERDIEVDGERASGRVLVLPEWRESRRHLLAEPDGVIRFVDS